MTRRFSGVSRPAENAATGNGSGSATAGELTASAPRAPRRWVTNWVATAKSHTRLQRTPGDYITQAGGCRSTSQLAL
jgi:hypothetical protein